MSSQQPQGAQQAQPAQAQQAQAAPPRPLNPPFKKTNENGRYWCRHEDIPKELRMLAELDIKNADGEPVLFQGYYYRYEKPRSGTGSPFLVQYSQEEWKAKQEGKSQQYQNDYPKTYVSSIMIMPVEQANELLSPAIQPLGSDPIVREYDENQKAMWLVKLAVRKPISDYEAPKPEPTAPAASKQPEKKGDKK